MQIAAERDFPIALGPVNKLNTLMGCFGSIPRVILDRLTRRGRKGAAKRGIQTDQWMRTLPPASKPDWINFTAVGICSRRFSSSTSSTSIQWW